MRKTGIRDKFRPYIPAFALDLLRRFRDVPHVVQLRQKYLGEGRITAILRAIEIFIAPSRSITYYPVRPSPAFLEYKICALRNIGITDKPRHFQQVLHRRDFLTRSPLEAELKVLSANTRINCKDIDISKSRVAEVFEQVFGYSLTINPLTWNGKAVKKSDMNYTHDGEIIYCPISVIPAEPGAAHVFQKAIDNRTSLDEVMDIRVPVIGGCIPTVQRKWRPLNDRFSNNNRYVDVVEPEQVLSQIELRQLLEFVEAMALNFCELDVLRDQEDGRIYVVDCNSTPGFGPPPGMGIDMQTDYLLKIADAYVELIALD